MGSPGSALCYCCLEPKGEERGGRVRVEKRGGKEMPPPNSGPMFAEGHNKHNNCCETRSQYLRAFMGLSLLLCGLICVHKYQEIVQQYTAYSLHGCQ